jgi:hypothetical protein
MDTGWADSDPLNQKDPLYAGPWVQPSEVAWHRDKLVNFGGVRLRTGDAEVWSRRDERSVEEQQDITAHTNVHSTFARAFNRRRRQFDAASGKTAHTPLQSDRHWMEISQPEAIPTNILDCNVRRTERPMSVQRQS